MVRTPRAAAAVAGGKYKEESSSELSEKEEDDLGVEVVNTQTFARFASQATAATSTDVTAASSSKRKIVDKEKEVKVVKKARGKKVAMVPVTRTAGMRMLVGAHVSMAGGVQHAITNSNNIGGNTFALFLKSQRKWQSPAMKEEDVKAFRAGCEKNGLDPKRHILPHGSYLINLATNDADKAQKGYDCFLDDLKRCERLGIGLYNFHPGSTLGLPRRDALSRVAKALNRAHAETEFCRTVLENMAGHKNIIGSDLEDLRDIIAEVDNKDRVGICLDTCHLFAAGYDICTQKSYDAVMADFDRIIGRKYLVALHINDSKAPLGAKRDLHQNIGLGFLGLEAFRLIMNDERLEGLPLILETPMEEEKTWAVEIKLLESLIGVPGDDAEFLEKAKVLADKGEKERTEARAAASKKAAKATTPKAKKRAKKSKKVDSDSEGYDIDDEDHSC